ncbi:hypothetical protein JCM8547_000011 [Rhodosporidiobolus lusitaniae]
MTSPRDQQTVLQHSAMKGLQSFSLLTPPILLLRSLILRRPLSLSASLRSLTLLTFVAGPVGGAGLEIGRLYWQRIGEGELREKAQRIRANQGQRRADDYTVIGGVLGSLVLTTLLLRRAPLPWVLGGGASLGSTGGVLTHVVKGYSEGRDTTSLGMVKEEVKGAVGAKGR